jgi:hypothetical protein
MLMASSIGLAQKLERVTASLIAAIIAAWQEEEFKARIQSHASDIADGR